MSNKYQLNKADLLKIGKGALIAIIGALLTYLSETILNVEFGAYTPTVVALWSVIVNAVRKYLAK